MDIKTQTADIGTIGELSEGKSQPLNEVATSEGPTVTEGVSNLREYGRIVVVRGTEFEQTITIPLDPEKEERRYQNLIDNRGPIKIDSTGSDV